MADAEATIDTRNAIASYSFGIKNKRFCEECEKLFLYLEIPYRKRVLKNEIKLEVLLKYFSSTIGKYMRHSDKIQRLQNKPIASDKIYFQILHEEKNITAKALAKRLNYNVDHARRILRMFHRMRIADRKGEGTRFSPYIYYIK